MLDVKSNFKTRYINQDINCRLGCSLEENLQHLFQCDVLLKQMREEKKQIHDQINVKFLFGTIDEQLKVTKYLMELFETRNNIC